MALDDYLWDILEKLHLADFFDDHNLPPILFLLLLLILLIPLVVFLVYAPAGDGGGSGALASCGDGLCQTSLGESASNCPDDCPTTAEELKTVIVEIVGGNQGNIEMRLLDADGYLIRADTGTTDEFSINGIRDDAVSVSVRNPQNGKAVSTDLIELKDKVTTIPVSLPPGFFDVETTVPPSKGTLRVTVRDAESGDLLQARISIVIPSGSSYLLIKSRQINGMDHFTLDSGEWYAILADSPGYRQFSNLGNPVRVGVSDEKEVVAEMERVSGTTLNGTNNVTGQSLVTVCVKNESGTLMQEGSVEMISLSGTRIAVQALTSGCTVFEVPSAGLVTLSTADLPATCVGSSTPPIQLRPAEMSFNLTVVCDSNANGRVRAKVLSENGTILTQDAALNLFYAAGRQIPGNGPGNSLANGVGGYTEYLQVSALEPFYFIVMNLDGYATYQSEEYAIDPNESRSIELQLSRPPPPELNVTIQGVSYPNPVTVGEPFAISVANVLYGQTDVTDFANVTASVAGVPCQVRKEGAWMADCLAPSDSGDYEFVVSALYEDKEGEKVGKISVLARGQALFTLTPHAILDNSPPIQIGMDITFNNTALDSLTDSQVAVVYEDGGAVVDNRMHLSGGAGLYSMEVDTPFDGAHRAEINLLKIKYNKIYEQNFTITFDVSIPSPRVQHEVGINPVILEPGEEFVVDVRILRGGEEVAGLSNVYFTLEEQRSTLVWDSSSHTYQLRFLAPDLEGIYDTLFELGTQTLTRDEKIYVVDTSKDKTEGCEISNCKIIPEVRKCVQEHRYQSRYSEQETIRCIESGWIPGGGSELAHCLSSSANRGDWNNDYRLGSGGTSSDVDIMTQFLQRVPDPDERNAFMGCGDMDNDGDVDADDLECLKNVAAEKWFGDLGNGIPPGNMKGGFCFDVERGLPGDFDGDKNFGTPDLNIMGKIVLAASHGIKPPDELLEIADFDSDGILDSSDRQCLEHIAGDSTIPTDCLQIYGFGCDQTRGDLSVDGELDEMDLLLMSWVVYGRADSTDVFTCADITEDDEIDEHDLLCISGLVTEDQDEVEEHCTECQVRMNQLGRYGNEICHDGLDNNCNGAIDDDCGCDSSQDCGRKYDNDGLDNTNDFKYCRALSWRGGGGYHWYWPDDYTRCTQEIQCETRACEGHSQTCSSYGGKGEWFGGGLPEEDDETRCEDGWDNDCVDGDEKCDRSSCFPSGTKISMADGTLRDIEDVRVGDRVLSYDIENMALTTEEVLELESPVRDHLYTLSFADSDALRITSEHPLYAKGKGWASLEPQETYEDSGQTVSLLEKGDEVMTVDGTWSEITDIFYQEIPEGIQTYNLKRISSNNNFFADGFLAHNKGCLYIYSTSDEGMSLDHLAYPFSILPSWEEYSYGTMPNLEPDGRSLKIRLSEELPEITHINHVRLMAVDHPADAIVIPSPEGEPHTLSNLESPESCIAKDGTDCLRAVFREDDMSYVFDLERLRTENITDNYDELVLSFEKPPSAEKAKMLIRGRESGVITFVWWKVLERVGRNNMEDFLGSLESNPLEAMIFTIFAESNAKVTVQLWGGSGWRTVGSEYLGFSNHGLGGETLLPVEVPRGHDELKVRLLSSKGTFEIDYVAVDYSEDLPVDVMPLPMIGASAWNGDEDALLKIHRDDDEYLTFGKGGWVDVEFADVPGKPGLERSYLVAPKGYYDYDIRTEQTLTPETEAWIMKMLTDGDYLRRYVLDNYVGNEEEFFEFYSGS